jgi:hypothetical protein
MRFMVTAKGFWVASALLLLASIPAGATPPGDVSASAPGATSEAPIVPGQYKCYNALNAVASSEELNSGRYVAEHIGNYMWIIDGEHYADASKSPSDSGSYHRVGDQIVPENGPWARAEAVVHYVLQGIQGKPTLQIAYKGGNHNHLTCTH